MVIFYFHKMFFQTPAASLQLLFRYYCHDFPSPSPTKHEPSVFFSYLHNSALSLFRNELIKCSSKMLENLSYFCNSKLLFLFFISCCFISLPIECPILSRPGPDQGMQGIHKVTQKDINGKINFVFSYSKNMVDFEAFLQEHLIKHTPVLSEGCSSLSTKKFKY